MAQLKNTKILLVANSEWYFVNFRIELLHYLRSLGFEVILIFPFEKNSNKSLEIFKCYDSPVKRGSLNPFSLIGYFNLLNQIKNKHNIKAINAFSIQICILTAICNLYFKIPSILSITGLGYSFISNSLKAKLIRAFIVLFGKFLFENKFTHFIFQNPDDRITLFKIIKSIRLQSSLIFGSGVNTTIFKPQPKKKRNSKIVFVFAGRLIYDKGIRELIDAYKKLLSTTENISLLIAGEIDPNNPASVSADHVKEWQKLPGIKFLSHIDKMQTIYSQADIAVLPSYREGLSRVLIEAASSGLAIITSDAPGCREVVLENNNGFLVPIKSSELLFEKMRRFVTEPHLIESFGEESRKIAKKQFSSTKINLKTVEVYNHVLAKNE